MLYLLEMGRETLRHPQRANIDYIMVHWGLSDYRDEEAVKLCRGARKKSIGRLNYESFKSLQLQM